MRDINQAQALADQYARYDVGLAAAIARGGEDDALFLPWRLGVTPKVTFDLKFNHTHIIPYAKIPIMFSMENNVGDTEEPVRIEVVGGIKLLQEMGLIKLGVRVVGMLPLAARTTLRTPMLSVWPEARVQLTPSAQLWLGMIPLAGDWTSSPTSSATAEPTVRSKPASAPPFRAPLARFLAVSATHALRGAMRRFLAVVVLLVPLAAAHAQNTGGTNGGTDVDSTATATGSVAPTATGSASASTTAQSHITGYGYSDHPTRGVQRPLTIRSGHAVHHPPVTHGASGPIATLPGFEMLGDGGSRLFVELTQSVQVEQRQARGSLTYVLKGAHVSVHNNVNPLVTVHFNTPVTQARLVPSGHDLLFVIDSRAAVTPTWKLNPAKEGSAVLDIDFPKGTYVSGQRSRGLRSRSPLRSGSPGSCASARAGEDLKEELDVHADQVTLDVRMRELELEGHVRADAPPFHPVGQPPQPPSLSPRHHRRR